jgi:hypothetical protein
LTISATYLRLIESLTNNYGINTNNVVFILGGHILGGYLGVSRLIFYERKVNFHEIIDQENTENTTAT